MLTGPYADPMIQQNFADPNTGIFDPNRVSQFLSQMAQDKTGQQRAQWNTFEEGLIKSRKVSKYTSLITKGVYVPRYMVAKYAALANSTSSMLFVQLPYTMISDDQVKISDADIKAYIDKNKSLFEVQEPVAKAEYVSFDIIPSTNDTAASLGALNALREEFISTTSNEEFVAKHSEETFNEQYLFEDKLAVSNPAEVMLLPVGGVAGPFYYNGMYTLAKVLDKKSLPDSVKASHILIAITETRTETQAKASIDSLEGMVKAGTPIEALAARSDDQGSATKGGDLGYFTQGQMVPEFNDVCFNGKTGDLKVVKTQFGYHLIKITDQKNFKPAIKLAMVSKILQPGNTTIQAAYTLASTFIASAKDTKSFDETAKKMNKDKRIADNITQTQVMMQGLGSAREVSRWCFDNKIGSVSPVFNLDDKCVIVKIVDRVEKGTLAQPNAVRPQVENILKREKKSVIIAEKAKGKKTLEDIALLANAEVKRADTLMYAGNGNAALGFEPRVIGAAFNKSLVGKVSPAIPGEQGVYFILLNNINEAPAPDLKNPMITMQARQQESQMMGQADSYIPYILRKKAKIEDNRHLFY
jgi:peptidyl-prolyl cis-trans isomerase D